MLKKLLLAVFVSSLLFISLNAKAATFINNQVVDKGKNWTIHFNQDVGFDDATKNAIVVTDSSGNKVNVSVNLGIDNKTIVVGAPKDGYEAGAKYELTVGNGVHSVNGKGISGQAKMDFSIKDDVEEKGNTNGNIIDNGLFAEDNSYIYYDTFSTDDKLYKMNKDGSNKVKLADDSPSYINVYNGYIYYSNGNDGYKIYRIKTDGTGRTKLSDDKISSYINVVDGFIYYADKNGFMYKMKLDGSGKIKLTGDCVQDINVSNGWIYYMNDSDNGNMYKIDINGSNETELTKETVDDVIVDGNSIYYTKWNSNGVFKMDLSGRSETKICDKGGAINVNGKHIYFSPSNGGIYRMDLDGENVIKLAECNPMDYINVIDDSVYFVDLINKDKANLYKMNIDGTNKIMLQ